MPLDEQKHGTKVEDLVLGRHKTVHCHAQFILQICLLHLYGVELFLGARHGLKYDNSQFSQFCTGSSMSGPGGVEVSYRHSYFKHKTFTYVSTYANSRVTLSTHVLHVHPCGLGVVSKRHIVDTLFKNILSFV